MQDSANNEAPQHWNAGGRNSANARYDNGRKQKTSNGRTCLQIDPDDQVLVLNFLGRPEEFVFGRSLWFADKFIHNGTIFQIEEINATYGAIAKEVGRARY